jgi:hypothetical protein
MATGTRGIATQSDANELYVATVGGLAIGPYQNINEAKRCITKSSAVSAGFTVSGTYANNQLVKYSDLSCSAPLIIRLTIDISSDSTLYNNGPITFTPAGARVEFEPILPRAAAPKIEDVREVESSEIVDNDTETLSLSYNEDTLLDKDYVDEPMSLMSIDEVLQVADEFEKETFDNIHGAPIAILGVTLTKDGGTNLLTDTSYGPAFVMSKKVTYTLLSKTVASSSDYGQYVLSHKGAAMSYLVNSSGLCPAGGLYVLNSTSSAQNQSITISGPGTYTFNAYWIKKSGSVTPDPSTPTTTYKVRVRIQLVDIQVYSFRVGIGDWTIYGSAGIELGSGSFPATEYRPTQLPADMDTSQVTPGSGSSWYYIEIWSGTTRPLYIDPGAISFSHRANNMAYWNAGSYSIVNDMNIYYGYALNQGHSTTIYNFDLRCSGIHML